MKASQAGIVDLAGNDEQFGTTVEISHGAGFRSLYANLSSISVSEGQCVEAGDFIGKTGCTGVCSKPQLYFELSRLGTALDPSKYIRNIAATEWRDVEPSELLDAVSGTVQDKFFDKELLKKSAGRTRLRRKDSRSDPHALPKKQWR